MAFTPSPQFAKFRESLAGEKRELWDFAYQFTRDTALLFVGFCLASACRGETDIWTILRTFRKAYRDQIKVVQGGGRA